MVDWNPEVGVDAYENRAGTVGKFALGDTNDQRLRLLEFAEMNDLVLSNTLLNHKNPRRVTWISPDGLTRNQIGFILVQRKFHSSLLLQATLYFLELTSAAIITL